MKLISDKRTFWGLELNVLQEEIAELAAPCGWMRTLESEETETKVFKFRYFIFKKSL